MGIPTATKIAIIAMSRNVLTHACIDNSSSYNYFFYLKNNKQIKHEINRLMAWIDLTLLFARRPLG